MHYRGLFLFLLASLFLISTSSAFMETFEYHPSNDVELSWDNDTDNYGAEPWVFIDGHTDLGSASASILYNNIQCSNVTRLYAYAKTNAAPSTTYSAIQSAEHLNTDYFSFNLVYAALTNEYTPSNSLGTFVVDVWDVNGAGPSSITLLSQTRFVSGSYVFPETGLYELQVIGAQIYLVINGTSQGAVSAWTGENIGYVRFRSECTTLGAVRWQHMIVYLDDISTSNAAGIHADRSPTSYNTHYMTHTALDPDDQPDYEVTASYTLSTLTTTPTNAQYLMKVRRIYDGSITNTTTIKDAGVAWSDSVTPFGTVLYNRTDIFGENFGLYQFYTTKDGVIQSYDLVNWQYTSLSGNSWVDIPDTISSDTEVDIDYYIDAPEFGDYNYYIKVYDPDYAIVQSYSITIASGTETLDTSGYDPGIYIVIMTAVAKSSGASYDIAYDMATISNEVIVVGTTYNATDNSIIPTVYINDSQGSTWFNTTSDGSGDYELQGFSSDISTSINASKTNYTHEDFTWTPPQVGMYTMDLYLFPSNRTLTDNATMLEGMVVSYPLYQGLGNATVNVYNATWSDNMTASTWGYYNFSNITAGDYTVNATLLGYTDSSEYSVTISNNNSTVQNIVLHPIFTLTVTAEDSETTASLSEFTAIVNGETISTTNGTATFTLDYGLYTISVSSSGYYPNTANVLVNQNKSVEVGLTSVESIYYNPHYVKFTVWGLAGYYEDVDVSVYKYGESDTTFTGVTGTDGSVTFKLSETQRYRITFISSSQGIDKEMILYPVENSYLVFISSTSPWDEYSTPLNEAIDIDVTTAIINSTAAYVNVSYNDTLQQTTAAIVYLNQTNNSDPYNQTIIGSQDGFSNNWTHSFIVMNYTGESYYVHVVAAHDTYGTIDKTYAVSFNDDIIFDGIPSKFFLYLSIFVMLFSGAMFGAQSVGQGSMIVCVEGWIFLAFGWFNSIDSGLIMVGLGFATVFSLVYIINQKTRKEGVE